MCIMMPISFILIVTMSFEIKYGTGLFHTYITDKALPKRLNYWFLRIKTHVK